VPFHGDSTAAVAISICTRTPQPPSSHRPDIPPALDELVLSILQRDPDRRPETLAVLARALRGVLRGSLADDHPRRSSRPTPLPVRAHPSSRPVPTQRMTPTNATMVMSRPPSGSTPSASPVSGSSARYAFAAALSGLALGLIGSAAVLVWRPAPATEQVAASIGAAERIDRVASELSAAPIATTRTATPHTDRVAANAPSGSAQPAAAAPSASSPPRRAAPVVTARSPWAALSAAPPSARQSIRK
jgi:serine/threonine-protein kinase